MIDSYFIIGGVRIDRNTTIEDLKKSGQFRVYENSEYPIFNSKLNETLSFLESDCLVEISYSGRQLEEIRLDYWDPVLFEGLTWGTDEYQGKECSCFLNLMRRHYGEPDSIDENGFWYKFEGGGVVSPLVKPDPHDCLSDGGFLRIYFDRRG